VIEITADLVRRLVGEQFPGWRQLAVTPVDRQGNDNRTFRLGDRLVVRLPSAEWYAAAVDKEDRWLPLLAGHLPVPVPAPMAIGRPAAGYPFAWSVRRWLAGDPVEDAADVDRMALARDLGAFLTALRAVPAEPGPACGRHSFFRGCHPSVYSDDVQRSLGELAGLVDVAACRTVWADALVSAWPAGPVWFHGDVAAGNLLTAGGRLAAVIDFGTCGVGDPACDLVMAWTYFAGPERKAFRAAAGLADDVWRRARGWALWKALLVAAGRPAASSGGDPVPPEIAEIEAILADPVV
jgi:aminoglycoside phosphotransferase (APT) family kinase protein